MWVWIRTFRLPRHPLHQGGLEPWDTPLPERLVVKSHPPNRHRQIHYYILRQQHNCVIFLGDRPRLIESFMRIHVSLVNITKGWIFWSGKRLVCPRMRFPYPTWINSWWIIFFSHKFSKKMKLMCFHRKFESLSKLENIWRHDRILFVISRGVWVLLHTVILHNRTLSHMLCLLWEK